jgi:hypothetical protein
MIASSHSIFDTTEVTVERHIYEYPDRPPIHTVEVRVKTRTDSDFILSLSSDRPPKLTTP